MSDSHRMLVRLFELRHGPVLSRARAPVLKLTDMTWPRAKELLTDPGGYFRLVLEYWEMVATLCLADELLRELMFDTTREFLDVWDRITPWIDYGRDDGLSAGFMFNLQLLVAQYHKDRPPKRSVTKAQGTRP